MVQIYRMPLVLCQAMGAGVANSYASFHKPQHGSSAPTPIANFRATPDPSNPSALLTSVRQLAPITVGAAN